MSNLRVLQGSRAERRSGMNGEVRLRLLEADVDKQEEDIGEMRGDLRQVKTIALSILVTTIVAALTGFLNLAFKAVG